MSDVVRVLIADDQALVRAGFKMILLFRLTLVNFYYF